MTDKPEWLRLSSRIVIAFVLMTMTVAGAFSVALLVMVEHVEERLVSDAMNRTLDQLMLDANGASLHQLVDQQRFYDVPEGLQSALPAWLAALETGLHEGEVDGIEVHALIRDRDGRRLVLLEDQSDFERREALMRMIVASGFVLSILLATALGMLLARRIMAPVIALAQQVRRIEPRADAPPTLAPHFAHDEVGQLAAAFDQTLAHLGRALARERLFTSDISHELRNPLMVIASSCELLVETLPAESAQRHQARRIARACTEMQELVETMLGLARDPDQRTEGMRTLALADVAAAQITRWQPIAVERGLALKLRDDGADTRARPAALLATVLSNLIRNALHYTEHGGVDVILHKNGFSVIDTGVGIPATRRERLFEPFVRGDPSRGDGIGIGLSLVARICEQQGWAIELTDNSPGGCDFRIDLDTS